MAVGKVMAGIAAALVAAEGVYSATAKSQARLLRPPGAHSEADFIARCIKCGKCIEACPYAALHAASAKTGAASGTPCIDARAQACRMCDDFPCVAACPSGALRDVSTREDMHVGYALIDENVCIAYLGYRCEVCYRVCPLIDEAITLEFEGVEGDSIHTKFEPVINRKTCTGCGLCVERCAVSEPRVPIRIVTLAEQESKNRR